MSKVALYVPLETLFERGTPWHELKAEPIIDHGKSA